ncbi:hypothetical protein BDW71DRAFT_177311 [Aspergillus fruticulosus]
MNNRPVDQALTTLLPTHAQDIPQELRSLALSFVAQSRSSSSSLKPDEEIARPFACAELACKRLARTLNLPPLLGHPPCPPRTYKKLYSFLERSLNLASPRRTESASAPGTPSHSHSGTAPSTPTKHSKVVRTAPKAAPTRQGLENTPSKPTPLKRAYNDDESRTTQQPHKVHSDSHLTSTNIPDAPSWVMVSIRTVCKTLSTPAPRMSTWSRPPISRALPPHIFAGVSSILHLVDSQDDFDEDAMEFLEPVLTAKDREKDEYFKEIVNALVVAVYFLALARRRQPSESSDTAQEETRKMDKKTFTEMRQTALTSLGLPHSERRHREDVDQWIALVMEQDWAHGREWFENIPQAGDLDGDSEILSNGEGHPGDSGNKRLKSLPGDCGLFASGDASRHGLLPGLGTMMQDRVDWLSPERREDYAEWKANILARIEQAEAAARD